MTERRKKYQTAKPKGSKRRLGEDNKKFAVKPGKYYSFTPVKYFKSKKKAKQYSQKVKKERPAVRHRIVTNSPKTYKRIHRKYTLYQTIYP